MKKQGAKEYIIENYHQLQELANEIPSSAENYSLLLCVLGEGEVKNDYREVCEQYIQGNTETAATVFEKIKSSFKHQDRKSTRLNSSHVKISYAVFCLKK